MLWHITKTGLEIFDLCRAYGLAALLDCASPEEERPVIMEARSSYLVEHELSGITNERLLENTAWHSLFEESSGDRTWSRVFLTAKQKWPQKVQKVKDILSNDIQKLILDFQDHRQSPEISTSKGESLPGPLDPSSFKGLRGKTAGDYSEGQTKVDPKNWALACLGGAISGRYKVQRSRGNKWDYFAVFPVPYRIEINNFREIRRTTYEVGLKYLSIRNAAAHFSVVLADKIRAMAAAKSKFADRFSGLFYFSMFQSGQQYKPSSGGNMSLYPLMDLAFSTNPAVAKVFAVWDYLFRKGSNKGCEDLAEAITSFIMNPSLESYENHIKIILKYISRPKEIKSINLYDDETLKEVIAYVR